MTLDEAIKILERHLHPENYSHPDRVVKAGELGIEALKRLKEYREWHRSTADGPLPGETAE